MTTMKLNKILLVTVEYELIKDTCSKVLQRIYDAVPMAAMIKTKLPLKRHAYATVSYC